MHKHTDAYNTDAHTYTCAEACMHTHGHTYIQRHANVTTKAILRNQAHACQSNRNSLEKLR